MAKRADFGLQIMSADGVFYDARAVSVKIPCADGEMEILAHHEKMMVAVYYGMMRIITDAGETIEAVVGNGSCQIANNRCTILASVADTPENIDARNAQEALEIARERMRQQQSIKEYHISQAAMARALSKLKAANKYND